MRYFFFLILFWPSVVYGASCPGPQINQGFGAQFPTATTVTGFTYDSGLNNLYVTFPNINYYTYTNVPQGVAYSFANTRTPDTFYSQQIASSYKAALSTQICQAILAENGTYIVLN